MPGKSRRSRGKHSFQAKKRGRKQTPAVTATQQPAAAQTYEPAVPSRAAAPSANVPTPIPTPVAKYPYVASELRRIGILAGIMLAVLIILSLVLS